MGFDAIASDGASEILGIWFIGIETAPGKAEPKVEQALSSFTLCLRV